MSNHYHLVVETVDGRLAEGMRHLNGVYTQYVNRTHQRVGHVFQGRYKAIFVDETNYLLEVVRYVVLNPVRACMVARADDWQWSSHRALLGLAPAPEWLAAERFLSQLHHERTLAVEAYKRFVHTGSTHPDFWQNLRGQIYLGEERFVSAVLERAGKLRAPSEIPRAQCQPAPKPISCYASTSPCRRSAMARAYLEGGHTMKAIAEHFGVHYATVSRAVREYE